MLLLFYSTQFAKPSTFLGFCSSPSLLPLDYLPSLWPGCHVKFPHTLSGLPGQKWPLLLLLYSYWFTQIHTGDQEHVCEWVFQLSLEVKECLPHNWLSRTVSTCMKVNKYFVTVDLWEHRDSRSLQLPESLVLRFLVNGVISLSMAYHVEFFIILSNCLNPLLLDPNNPHLSYIKLIIFNLYHFHFVLTWLTRCAGTLFLPRDIG